MYNIKEDGLLAKLKLEFKLISQFFLEEDNLSSITSDSFLKQGPESRQKFS